MLQFESVVVAYLVWTDTSRKLHLQHFRIVNSQEDRLFKAKGRFFCTCNAFAGPRGLSAPRLSSPSGRTVIIEWDPPSVPNGIILKYLIQRRKSSSGNPSDIAEVNASLSLRYVDNTTQPVTTYQYRVIAYNSGPGEPSPYSNVTTGEGGMGSNHVRCRLLAIDHFTVV